METLPTYLHVPKPCPPMLHISLALYLLPDFQCCKMLSCSVQHWFQLTTLKSGSGLNHESWSGLYSISLSVDSSHIVQPCSLGITYKWPVYYLVDRLTRLAIEPRRKAGLFQDCTYFLAHNHCENGWKTYKCSPQVGCACTTRVLGNAWQMNWYPQ